jgi:hypothetical protein
LMLTMTPVETSRSDLGHRMTIMKCMVAT